MVTGELILEVNSARRLSAARAWLEEIPGITYQDVKTRKIDEDRADVPMDEKMAAGQDVEMTPELISYLTDMFHQQYMNWLDKPLPVLSGKTPRETCKTEEGRKKVAILIRAILAPVCNPGVYINVPRKEMFRELNLELE